MQDDTNENDLAGIKGDQPLKEGSRPGMQYDERIIEPSNALPEVTLEALPEGLRAACARAGWTKLLPVQARAIPYLLADRNLMVQSQTGSGKTAVFLLPIMARIKMNKRLWSWYPPVSWPYRFHGRQSFWPETRECKRPLCMAV
jgi:hypothetical protein